MSFADSSETTLSIVPEAGWGLTPATPAFLNARFTSESLAYNIETTDSDEIRPDAEISDLIQVGAGAAGDLNFELSYDPTLQLIMAAALRGTWTADVLKASIVKPSFTIEKKFETGASDQYHRFPGIRFGTFNLGIQAKQKITGTAGTMGKGAVSGTVPVTGATYAAAGTNPVMAAPDVATIEVGGIAVPLYFTDLSIALTNNLRAQGAIGSIDNVGIGYGRRETTVNMTAYFENGALYDQFVAGAPTSLGYTVSDGANSYEILFPKLKYTQGTVVAGGNNQDIMVQAVARALVDPTEGTSLKITRVPA